MTALLIALLFAYLICSVLVGIAAHRGGNNTAEDYFLAGRSVSWLHLGLTFFATWFSTFAFLGAPGFFYKKGVTWFFTMGSFCLLAPLLGWFIGRRIWLLGRNRGYVTPADLLADRLRSERLRPLVALICILSLIPYSLIQIVGIGKVLAVGTAGTIPYWCGVVLAVSATAIYTFIGGVRAIVWTDFIQGILFLAILVLGAAVAYSMSGGLVEGFSAALAIRPSAFELDRASSGSPLTIVAIWLFGFIVLPHLWQRSYMAKSAQAFSRGLVVFAVLSFLLILCCMVIGMLSIGVVSELPDSDVLLPQLFQQHLPLAVPFLVLATFAAGMSTIDSQLLTASSVVVRDLIRPMRRSTMSSEDERSLGRWIVLLMILALGVLALLPGSQGSIIVLASKGTAICFLLTVPLCLALFHPNASGQATYWSLISGAALLFLLETKLVPLRLPLSFGPPIAAVLLQLLVFFVLNRYIVRPSLSEVEEAAELPLADRDMPREKNLVNDGHRTL